MAEKINAPLRTRVNRMERVVGLFVLLGVLIFIGNLGFYHYHQATRKGWFLQRVPYFLYVADATGLKVGDPVRMMGFDIGRITSVLPMPPTEWFVENEYNVFVQFEVIEPNYGYIWTDSRVRINPGDLLGNRQLEVIKGRNGGTTVVERDGVVTHIVSETNSNVTVEFKAGAKGVWLSEVEESAVVTERVGRLVSAVEAALPALTNQLTQVASIGVATLSNINLLTLESRAVATNLGVVAADLRVAGARLSEPGDALGRWLFPSNFNEQLETTLTTAQGALTGVDTNLALLVEQVAVSLENLALITSNLNAQVQANTNILSVISKAVVNTDELVQGLKRHWFLKGPFKK